eukprot:tig00000194_g14792.t1
MPEASVPVEGQIRFGPVSSSGRDSDAKRASSRGRSLLSSAVDEDGNPTDINASASNGLLFSVRIKSSANRFPDLVLRNALRLPPDLLAELIAPSGASGTGGSPAAAAPQSVGHGRPSSLASTSASAGVGQNVVIGVAVAVAAAAAAALVGAALAIRARRATRARFELFVPGSDVNVDKGGSMSPAVSLYGTPRASTSLNLSSGSAACADASDLDPIAAAEVPPDLEAPRAVSTTDMLKYRIVVI